MVTVRMTGSISGRLRHHHGGIVMSSREIPVEYTRDERGIAQCQARMGLDTCAGGQTVRMEDQHPVLRPRVTELLDAVNLMAGCTVQGNQMLSSLRSGVDDRRDIPSAGKGEARSEEHTSELQSLAY